MSDSPKLRSEAQREASRLNGAKSQGPKGTRDRRRHIVVLANEDPDTYDKLTAVWTERLQPADNAENRLVMQIVNADWRLNRLWQCETALLDEAMQTDSLPGTPSARMGRAMRNLADESTVLRYVKADAAQLERALHRALRTLERLRSAFPKTGENEKIEKPETEPLSDTKQNETLAETTREKPEKTRPNPDSRPLPSPPFIMQSDPLRHDDPCCEEPPLPDVA